jgi:GWxTD domain-containing protein
MSSATQNKSTKPGTGILIPVLFYLSIAIIGIFWGNNSGQTKQSPELRSTILEQNCVAAESLMAIDSLDQAEKLIKQNLKIDRRHAKTRFLLGELYRQRDSIISRRQSADNLRQAVNAEPNNDVYHYSLGLTYQNQGFMGNALSEFKKAARLNPQNSQALRNIAAIYESIGLRYDDKELYMSSMEYSAKAAAIDRDPADYYDQSKMLVKMDLFDQALSKADTALTLSPDTSLTKNLYLLRGLCNNQLGAFEAAYKDFEQAKALMNTNELANFDDIHAVVTPQEYQRLVSLTTYQRKTETARIWNSLDPDLTTAYNERRIEHYARQMYADISFSLPEKNIIGKDTKRGETLIRFGFPETKTYIYGEPLRHPPIGSSWVWGYFINGQEYSLRFEDIYHNGNFDYPFTGDGGNLSSNTAYLAQFLARTAAQKYEFVSAEPLLNFVYDVKQFKGNNGNTELEIFYNIPYHELSFTPQDGKAYADFEIKAALHDKDLNLLDSATIERRAKISTSLIGNTRLAISDNFPLEVHADSVYLSLAIKNPASNHVGRSKIPVGIRGFYSDQAEISDIVLAREVTYLDSAKSINRNSIKLSTNLDNRYFVSEPVVMYFEYYNLSKGDDQRTHYRIVQTVAKLKKPKLIGTITGYKIAEQVVTVYEESNVRTYENRLLTFDFSKFGAGRYRIIVQIEDTISGKSVSSSQDIILYE